MAERDRWSMNQMLEPMAREARAAPELAAFVATVGPLIASAPRGDGHPVLVLPGLGGGDTSTRPLRWFLDRLGYRTAGWGLGTNTGPGRRRLARPRRPAAAMVAEHGRRVSIVGWSLGGVYASALAARCAAARPRPSSRWAARCSAGRGVPPGVPMTSVYSRTDAIVPWRASLLAPGLRRENVEVRGSHLGLGHNPPVLVVVADRLAQPEEAWQPFVAPALGRDAGSPSPSPTLTAAAPPGPVRLRPGKSTRGQGTCNS